MRLTKLLHPRPLAVTFLLLTAQVVGLAFLAGPARAFHGGDELFSGVPSCSGGYDSDYNGADSPPPSGFANGKVTDAFSFTVPEAVRGRDITRLTFGAVSLWTGAAPATAATLVIKNGSYVRFDERTAGGAGWISWVNFTWATTSPPGPSNPANVAYINVDFVNQTMTSDKPWLTISGVTFRGDPSPTIPARYKGTWSYWVGFDSANPASGDVWRTARWLNCLGQTNYEWYESQNHSASGDKGFDRDFRLYATETLDDPALPAAPVQLATSNETSSVNVTWAYSGDGDPVTMYELTRTGASGSTTWTLGNVTYYNDTTAERSKHYNYTLKARNAVGTSPSVGPWPGAPSIANFAYTSAAESVTLTWTPAQIPGLLGYDIFIDGLRVATNHAAATYTYATTSGAVHDARVRWNVTAGPGPNASLQVVAGYELRTSGDYTFVGNFTRVVPDTFTVQVTRNLANYDALLQFFRYNEDEDSPEFPCETVTLLPGSTSATLTCPTTGATTELQAGAWRLYATNRVTGQYLADVNLELVVKWEDSAEAGGPGYTQPSLLPHDKAYLHDAAADSAKNQDFSVDHGATLASVRSVVVGFLTIVLFGALLIVMRR